MTQKHEPRGGGVLLGAGAAVLMVACCAVLPLLIAGGLFAGIGGFLSNAWVIGAGAAVLGLAVLASRRQHRGHDGPRCCLPAPTSSTDDVTDTKEDQNR